MWASSPLADIRDHKGTWNVRKDVHPNFLAHFIIMWSFSTAMPRSMTWAFLRWSNEHLNLLISSARLLLSRYPLHIPFACTNLSWIVVIGCSDFSFFHILLPRDSPLFSKPGLLDHPGTSVTALVAFHANQEPTDRSNFISWSLGVFWWRITSVIGEIPSPSCCGSWQTSSSPDAQLASEFLCLLPSLRFVFNLDRVRLSLVRLDFLELNAIASTVSGISQRMYRIHLIHRPNSLYLSLFVLCSLYMRHTCLQQLADSPAF